MQSTRITPNRTSLPRPMHPRNTIMIPRNQPHHIVPNHRILVTVNIIDPAYMQTDSGEQGFPPGDWMSPHDRVHGGELVVFVERRASRCHDIVFPSFACGLEDWLRAGCREGFHVRAEGGRHAVLELVAGAPEGVAAGGRSVLHSEKAEI